MGVATLHFTPLATTLDCTCTRVTNSYLTHLHGISEHPGKSEWNLLGELLSDHGHLKTVTEVNVKHTAS